MYEMGEKFQISILVDIVEAEGDQEEQEFNEKLISDVKALLGDHLNYSFDVFHIRATDFSFT